MRVVVGDIIGTKDGRVGTVSFVVTQDKFLVVEAPDPLEPMPETPPEFWTNSKNVASIR